MIYGLLVSLFATTCFSIIVLILIQQSKGSMGLGSIGGGSQMLFGGSGGQDMFQKTTWVLGLIVMASSMALAIVRSKGVGGSRYTSEKSAMPAPQAPTQTPAE